jgi:phosphotransferase system enzyme I (PtsP)
MVIPERSREMGASHGQGQGQVKDRTFSVQVHDAGDRTLDGIFRLISFGEREEPLEDVLTAMCGDVAAIARADIASIYVREDDQDAVRFTMRGNVGFPREALGRVHLRPGEGITGFAAERLRPVSVANADRDEHFKYIPGLGEERYPALLAVPVLRGGAAAGVLVLQRSRARAFTDEEVVLATALAAVINHALERGEARARSATATNERRAARLAGMPIVRGTAMGHAEVLPTLSALARTAPKPQAAIDPREIVKRLQTELRRAMIAARGSAASEIASLALILDDERFRARLAEACAAPAPLKALSEMARAYARVPFGGAKGDETSAAVLGHRAAEIEDLCVMVWGAAAGGRPLIRSGSIVVADQLRLFSTLHAIAAGASAFVVDGALTEDSAVATLVRAAGRPLLASVNGVFSWLRPDDLLVVDADAGLLRINPPATAVARFRNDRR